jgi:hypothetical protein
MRQLPWPHEPGKHLSFILLVLSCLFVAEAHVGAWHKGMQFISHIYLHAYSVP